MQKLYCVYRFKDDFILVGAFADEADALEFWKKKKADGTPNLFGDESGARPKVVEQDAVGLATFLLNEHINEKSRLAEVA